MILLAEKTKERNVLHVIVGPESEVMSDLRGGCVSELGHILNRMDNEVPLYIRVAFSKNEARTAAALAAQKPDMMIADGCDCENCDDKDSCAERRPGPKSTTKLLTAKNKQPKNKAVTKEPVTNLKTGTCEYCHNEIGLLPVPQVRICVTCAHIELMRSRSRDE